jgi:hypothetical protein
MPEVPEWIEVSPDSFKRVDDCSVEELRAAQVRYMEHALMGARDAGSQVDRDGGTSVVSDQIMRKAEDDHARADEIGRYIESRFSGA